MPAREKARKDRTDWKCGIVDKELMNGRVAKETMEESEEVRRAPRKRKLICTVTRTKEALETKAQAKARAKA